MFLPSSGYDIINFFFSTALSCFDRLMLDDKPGQGEVHKLTLALIVRGIKHTLHRKK